MSIIKLCHIWSFDSLSKVFGFNTKDIDKTSRASLETVTGETIYKLPGNLVDRFRGTTNTCFYQICHPALEPYFHCLAHAMHVIGQVCC